MRLVASSDPGAVERWNARRLLDERLVLTSAVVRELQRSNGSFASGRPAAALDLLRRWVAQHFETGVDVHPGDGIEDMIIPEDTDVELVDELWAATQVCEALAMLQTADTRSEYEGDTARIRELLEDYPY